MDEAPIQEESPEIIEDTPDPSLLRSLGNAVGLDRDSEMSQYSDKILILFQYAKSQTTDHTPEGLKKALRALEMKLGTPPRTESKISYLTRYAYLMNEKRKDEKVNVWNR